MITLNKIAVGHGCRKWIFRALFTRPSTLSLSQVHTFQFTIYKDTLFNLQGHRQKTRYFNACYEITGIKIYWFFILWLYIYIYIYIYIYRGYFTVARKYHFYFRHCFHHEKIKVIYFQSHRKLYGQNKFHQYVL